MFWTETENPMQLENTFTVPAGIDEAWAAFNDPRRVAPCFPGATL